MLKEKISCILWQLPGSQKADLKKLESFCKLLSKDFYNVFEFREKSWFNQDTLDILKNYNISFCMISSPGDNPGLIAATNKIAYIRFHGKGNWYADNYSDRELESWKEKLSSITARKIFVYFNNDANAYAVNNAITFERLFDRKMIVHNSNKI